MYWTAECVEIVVILASTYHENKLAKFVTRRLLFGQERAVVVGALTNSFLLGNALTFGGTILRLDSYHALGKYFTFELALFKDHRLVVTGPYSIIRHPSYAGLILSIIGAFINAFVASGGWITEGGMILETKWGICLAASWIMIAMAVIMSLLLRIPREEALLRQKFGREWEEWANEVPYCLVPGIY